MRKVFIAGVDGYLGWALAQYLAAKGFTVSGIDDCRRRDIWVPSCGSDSAIPIASLKDRIVAFLDQYGEHHFTGAKVNETTIKGFGNVARYDNLCKVFEEFQPDTIVNLAQMASAPYSMKDFEHANSTYVNNIGTTMAVLWAVKDVCPHVPIITIGTAGEYGTPGIKITEGDVKIELDGRSAELPFPKTPASLYHASKVASTVIYERACTWWNLAATDVMQGVVYGVKHEHMTSRPEMATRADIDQCFPPGVQVTTHHGQKSIEDIDTDDVVLTHKGRFLPVTETFENDYEGDLVHLKMNGSKNELECTPAHPLLVVTKKNGVFSGPEWTEAKTLLSEKEELEKLNLERTALFDQVMQLCDEHGWGGQRIATHLGRHDLSSSILSWVKYRSLRPVTRQRDARFLVYGRLSQVEDVACIDCAEYNVHATDGKHNVNHELKRPLPEKIPVDEEFLRLAGIYLADGSNSGYIVNFSLNDSSKQAEYDFATNYCSKNLGLHIMEDKGRPGVFSVSSKAFSTMMFDFFKAGAREKEIPPWVLLLPVEKQEALLDGIYACDGHNGNMLEITNRGVAHAVRLMESRRGYHASVYTRTRPEDSALPEGRVTRKETKTWTCHRNQTPTVGMNGKNSRYVIWGDLILVRIQEVSRVPYRGKVYNLHVSEDNSYVANTFCVHNCFGTALNRFVAQAIMGHPITVYGAGTQRRGFLPLRDSMRCLQLLIENPPEPGKVRIVNQYDQVYSINELAAAVEMVAKEHGICVFIEHITNPRWEIEEHFYEMEREKLVQLGYVPKGDLKTELHQLFEALIPHKERLEKYRAVVNPTVSWN